MDRHSYILFRLLRMTFTQTIAIDHEKVSSASDVSVETRISVPRNFSLQFWQNGGIGYVVLPKLRAGSLRGTNDIPLFIA